MPSIGFILSPYLSEEPAYAALNQVLANTTTIASLTKVGSRLKALCDSTEKQQYYTCLMFQLAAASALVEHAEDIFGHLFQVDIKQPETLLNRPYKHPGLTLPRGSMARAVFSLMAAVHFSKANVYAIKRMIIDNPYRLKNPLMCYVFSEDNKAAEIWFDFVKRETLPFAYHIRFHHYFSDIALVNEAREMVVDLDKTPFSRIVVNRITRCHAIFIVPEHSPFMYVAHVNPSQAENNHCIFRTPVNIFEKLPVFLAKLNKDERVKVLVFDHYGLSSLSLKRLDRELAELKEKGGRFQVVYPGQAMIKGLRDTFKDPYHICYEPKRRGFSLVQGKKVHRLMSLDDVFADDDSVSIPPLDSDALARPNSC